MQIKEKFLEKFEFNRIKECIEDDDFNWFYRNSIVEENDPPYFTHCFLMTTKLNHHTYLYLNHC